MWNDSRLGQTHETVCSMLVAIHTGRLVCGLDDSGHLPRYVINGEARDVIHGLLFGVDLNGLGVRDSQFKVILTEHAAKQMADSTSFIIERTSLSPILIVSIENRKRNIFTISGRLAYKRHRVVLNSKILIIV